MTNKVDTVHLSVILGMIIKYVASRIPEKKIQKYLIVTFNRLLKF